MILSLHFIENVIEHRLYALVAFLDIESAFNNITPEAIRSALGALNVHWSMVRFIRKLLTNRVIVSTMVSATVYRMDEKGTPQGGSSVQRYKVPSFSLPSLHGVELGLPDGVKYRGIILDSKLSWFQNTDTREAKANVALYAFVEPLEGAGV